MKKLLSLSDAFLIPLCLLFLYPFYYLVVSTLKTQSEMAFNPVGLPMKPDLANYAAQLGNGHLGQAFLNTTFLTVCSVLLIVVIGEMAAYPIVYRPGKLNTGFLFYIMIGFLVPFQAILLTLFDIMKNLHFINQLYGMVAFYSNGATLTVFLTVGYMRSIPKELVEAARIDGCSIPRTFFSILFPLLKPISVTSVIFNTMWIWNDFIAPNIFLNSRSKGTLVLELYRAKGQFNVDWPMFMTLSVMIILPIFIFYVFMQKYIIKGLTAGAVKG